MTICVLILRVLLSHAHKKNPQINGGFFIKLFVPVILKDKDTLGITHLGC
jgi:hypothetical protein